MSGFNTEKSKFRLSRVNNNRQYKIASEVEVYT